MSSGRRGREARAMKSKKRRASDEATAEVEALMSIARDPKAPAMARVLAAKEVLNLAVGPAEEMTDGE